MKYTPAAILFVLLTGACNSNKAKDSVETADSINKAKIDSPASQQPVVTDEATASFMVKAADGGMAEVQLSEMAQQKANRQSVKNFAEMMIREHTAVNEQLKAMAAQRNVTLPSAASQQHQAAMSDLAGKAGADFDKAYMRQMVKDHEATVDVFEKASGDVKETEIKNLINNTLPKLKNHLDSAKATLKTLK